jgi:hypothetical protein
VTQILAGVHLQGQSNATTPVAIATVAINFNSDGSWDFQDAAGNIVIYKGNVAEVNKLLELLFVGTGGLPVGTKLFGNA